MAVPSLCGGGGHGRPTLIHRHHGLLVTVCMITVQVERKAQREQHYAARRVASAAQRAHAKAAGIPYMPRPYVSHDKPAAPKSATFVRTTSAPVWSDTSNSGH